MQSHSGEAWGHRGGDLVESQYCPIEAGSVWPVQGERDEEIDGDAGARGYCRRLGGLHGNDFGLRPWRNVHWLVNAGRWRLIPSGGCRLTDKMMRKTTL